MGPKQTLHRLVGAANDAGTLPAGVRLMVDPPDGEPGPEGRHVYRVWLARGEARRLLMQFVLHVPGWSYVRLEYWHLDPRISTTWDVTPTEEQAATERAEGWVNSRHFEPLFAALVAAPDTLAVADHLAAAVE